MAKHKKPYQIWPLVMLIIGSFLIVGAVVGFVLTLKQSAPETTPTTSGERIPYPEIPRVSLKDARAAYELKTAIIVDVRGEPYYSEGHIPGALSIPLDDLPDRLNEFKTQDWIITYCT